MHTTLFRLAVVALALAAGSSALAAPNRITQPLQVKAAARPIAGLSPADRAGLPDATTVQLAGGRVATLGTLRTEHLARTAQFAGVARVDNLVHSPPQNTNIVPMKPPTTGPADYLAFCAPLRVSGCLYFPPNTVFTASDAAPASASRTAASSWAAAPAAGGATRRPTAAVSTPAHRPRASPSATASPR